MGWFLLPELPVINEVLRFSFAREEGRTYKDVYSFKLLVTLSTDNDLRFSLLANVVLTTDWCLSNLSRTISGFGNGKLRSPRILPLLPVPSLPPLTIKYIPLDSTLALFSNPCLF